MARILGHLGLPTTQPPLAPAQGPFEDDPQTTFELGIDEPSPDDEKAPRQGRAPPNRHR